MKNLYIQYGCGLCAPPDWRNFDASLTLRLQKLPLINQYFMRNQYPIFPPNVEYADIIKGLPISHESCKAVYCSHVLEHLALEDFWIAIKNTYSYLAKGGIFRFVVPDLEKLTRTYIESTATDAAIQFMEQSYLGMKQRPRNIQAILRQWLGNSTHLWMWDWKGISVELDNIGFKKVRLAEFGDSLDIRFKDVENKSRWIDCLGVECIK